MRLIGPPLAITTKLDPSVNPDPRSGFILLIAPARSYRVASYIQAAEKLGYRLLIVSDSRHSLVSAIADGITIDFDQPDQAFNTVIKSIQSKSIVTVIATDDRVVTLSSRIAKALGLAHNDPQATLLTYRKDLARIRLQQQHCNVPEFRVCAFEKIADIAEDLDYPVVIKPLMLSGSRGVIRADDAEQCIQAGHRVARIVQLETQDDYERNHCLIEQFLKGDEVAIEGFVQSGKFINLAMFDKPEPMNGPFFEESFYITPSRLPTHVQQAVIDEIERSCHAYGLTHGPIHAEARITDQGVFLLEMASRTIGGQCAQLIEFALGQKLEEVIIRLMCLEKLALSTNRQHAGVLMIPIPKGGILKRVEGLLDARRVDHISSIEIHIQPGYELIPLPEGSSYLGFIFASAASYDDTLQALKSAHEKLKFITAPRWHLQPA